MWLMQNFLFSLANIEMYLFVATVFRRFELELFETDRHRDIDSSRDYYVGVPSSNSPGFRVLLAKDMD